MTDYQNPIIHPASDVDESIRKNNYKLTADKIKQILGKLREIPSRSYRRWVWELMQNAKDVKNKFKRVSIQIVLKEDTLEFRHNGDPFLINHITALIQQVSSKASDSSDEEVTGKFGTGFIITHLLSDLINVKGIVERPGNLFRAFEIDLDRAGRTSEELLPKIEDATEHIRKIDQDDLFPIKEDYEENRVETDYDTVFTYNLSTEEKRKAAKTGIEDLKNTLPLTLANIPKIKRVEVIDKVEDIETAYECLIQNEDNNPREIIVKALWDKPFETRCFLVYDMDRFALNAEVTNFEDLELVAHFGKQPNLYRDFPLIGSEKFHFPFVLNGFHFFPTEDRDSILLNSEESEEAKENRATIEAAMQAAVEFSKLLISRNAKRLYHLVHTRLPEVHFEETAKAWYQELQTEWRGQLLDLPLVETENNESTQLRTCLIPYYGSEDETKLAFYDLTCSFVGPGKVPKKDFLLYWIKSVGPKEEIESWEGVELYYDLEKFVQDLEEKEEIENLTLEDHDIDIFEWLDQVLKFICQEKESELLSEYAIVPNEYGIFKKLSDLTEEDDQNPIPDHFLDLLKELGEDWRDELVNRKLDFSSLNLSKGGMSDASENINNYLKNGIRTEKGDQYKDFLQYPPAKDILINILKVTEDTTTGEGFRQQLFKLAKDFLQFEDEFTVVPGSASFNYAPATKLMIRLINQQIEESETVEGLSQQIDKTEEQTILWLDKYLRLLQGNSDYKQFLEDGNIIPNRYQQFCSFDVVHAFGTEGNPLDDKLLDILKALDPQEDWREFLIADGIGITLGQTKKLDELCNTIWEEITRIKGEDSYQQNREVLLDFIDWGESHEEQVNRYFTGFKAFADRAFFILTIERSMHGKQVMRLFKDEEQVRALSTISEAGINITDLLKLAEITQELGSAEEIIVYAQGLIEEKRDFEFLKELGETVEGVVQEALRNSELGAQADFEIVRQGWGACDLIIRNTSNQKEFYIEVKSYAFGRRDDIKMALSQVRLCLERPDQFALCVIERPAILDTSYIRDKMKWVSNVSGVVKGPFDLYSNFYEGKNHLGDATLEVQLLGEVKVALRLHYIEQNFSSFNELIEEITRRLQ